MRWRNPVLIREMRARVKGKRSFIIQLIFLTIFLLIYLPLYYYLLEGETPWMDNNSSFEMLFLVMMGFVGVVAPAFCSGSITGEREQKTLASLLAFLLLLISSLFFAALALFFSSVSKRTATATAITYGCIAVLVIGTPILEAYLSSRPPLPNGEPHPMTGALYLNPFMGLLSIFAEEEGLGDAMPYKAVLLPLWAVNMILLVILTFCFWWLTARKFRKMERT